VAGQPTTQEYSVGDTRRPIEAVLRGPGGSVLDLSDGSIEVYFKMASAKSPYTVKVNALAEKVVVNGGAAGATGKVRYVWQAADLNTVGKYFAWWVVKQGGLQETFPTGNRFSIAVMPTDGSPMPG